MENTPNNINFKNVINVKYDRFGLIKPISSLLQDQNLAFTTNSISFELKTGEVIKIDKDTESSNYQKVIYPEIFYNSLKIELTDETVEELKNIEKDSLLIVVEHDFKEIWGRFINFKYDPPYSFLELTTEHKLFLEPSYYTPIKQIFVYEKP